MLRVLLAILVLGVTFSANAERVKIQINQDFYPGDKIYIKRELNRQGYDARDYKLRSVKVIARGRGPISLMMNGQEVDRKGLLRDGQERRNGDYAVNLDASNRGRLQNGAWQLHFVGGNRARMKVRRIVVDIKPKWDDRDDRWGRSQFHTINLASFHGRVNQVWEAPRGRRIVDVRLLREYSSNRKCRRHGGFGYNRYEVWVDNGCRGKFEVETR